jgi:hypothetical protein
VESKRGTIRRVKLLFNRVFLKTLGPTFTALLQIVTLIGALYGFVKVIVDLGGLLQHPRLNVYMSDLVWPVGGPGGTWQCAINVQFVVYNPTGRMVALRRLEAELIRPSWTADETWGQMRNHVYPKEEFPLEWNHLIKGGPSGFENAEPVVIKPIPAHGLEVLGVELLEDLWSRQNMEKYVWVPGEYILRLYGYLNVNDARTELSPSAGFRFKVDDGLAKELDSPESAVRIGRPSNNDSTELITRPARLVNSSGGQRK